MSARVLVVDDNRALAENLAEALECEGSIAEVAASGEEALAILEVRCFDLVITDVRMPGIDGLEVLRAIHRRSPGCPVVVMTAYARDLVIDPKLFEEPHVRLLEKPFSPQRLLALVQEVVPS
jgi:CheY-like chemotaxis protein